MKKTSIFLIVSTLMSNMLFAQDIAIESIGLNIGKNNSDYSQDDHQGSIILGNTPDKRFLSYELYATLKNYTLYSMKPYLSVTCAKNDELKHKYILAGLNKYYTPEGKKYDFYAGVLAGYGILKWEYDPLNTAKVINADANGFIAGVQIGVNHPIAERVYIGLNAKYLRHEYATKLNPTAGTSSTIKHQNTTALMIGLSYKF